MFLLILFVNFLRAPCGVLIIGVIAVVFLINFHILLGWLLFKHSIARNHFWISLDI